MLDCSKTENYLAEKLRLTKKHKLNDDTYICGIACGDCPLSRVGQKFTKSTHTFIAEVC